MSRIKELVPEWEDVEQRAEEDYRSAGKPTRAPYFGSTLTDIVYRLRWQQIQQAIWRKKHGF